MLGTIMAMAAQTTSIIGDFTYVEAADPMNDSAIYAAITEAEGADLTLACNKNRASTIYVRLETKRTLQYATSPLLAEFMTFEYRIDGEKPVSEFVRYGDHEVIVEGPQARAFAERLSSGLKVVIRVEGLSEYIIPTFHIGGAREVVTKLAQQCGDKRLIDRLARTNNKAAQN
jgi:hypothetical protein